MGEELDVDGESACRPVAEQKVRAFGVGGSLRLGCAESNSELTSETKTKGKGSWNMTIWVARAGKYGERENLALEEGRAFIGWPELGDLSKHKSRDEIQKLLEEAYPDDVKLGTVKNHAAQIFNFQKSMQVGDMFALPLKTRHAIAFGKVAGEYEYLADNPEDVRHSRKIEWMKGEPISRSEFDQDILYSFGSALTVFRVIKNDAEERVKAVIAGKGKIKSQLETSSSASESDEDDFPNLAQIARQRIIDLIGRKFKGPPLEHLVAEVLMAQGFEVRVNRRKGPDGGADILAGRGPMGFDQPRLCVQVKSLDTAIGSKDYDELKGVMQKFGADHGLFVSWGGFKGTVEEEAKRNFFNIRLWNAEDLVNEIQNVYSNLPQEIRADIPMQQVWVLMDEA